MQTSPIDNGWPHDFSFMQTFHEGMRIVQALDANDFTMPKDAEIPDPMHREVARIYVERRDFKVSEVLDAVLLFAQPGLLETNTEDLYMTAFDSVVDAETNTMLGPLPLLAGQS